MDFFTVDRADLYLRTYIFPALGNLALAVIVFFAGRLIARVLTSGLSAVMRRSKVDEALAKFIAEIAYAFLLVVVVITALERLGIKTTAAIAILGAAGLAVGLAMQGFLSNFAAGVLLILFKPFRVGDFVSAAGQTGTVEAVRIFNTVLVSVDNRQIVVPNNKIYAEVIDNYSARGTRRLDLKIGIGYGDDIGKARDVVLEVIRGEPRVLTEPAPGVSVVGFGDSSVDLLVTPWVKPEDYLRVKGALLEQIKQAFDRAGVTIPFPQRDVHVKQ
jgi:small conductance mechanosensitive channel